MSRCAYIALILAVVGFIVFGVGAALVAVLGWDPERIYIICLIGFASFTLNFLLPIRPRRTKKTLPSEG